MAATGTIIAAIIGAGIAIYSGVKSSNEMDKAQRESRDIAGRQEAQQKKEFAANLRIRNAELAQSAANTAENARQFNIEAGRAQENDAYTKFENQFQKLAGYMSKNQELEDLFINRLKGLRG